MDRRTALISAASVLGVVLAGATAVGANIGILDRADNTGLGELSAATVEPRVVDVQLDRGGPTATAVASTAEPASASSTGGQPTQVFLVEDAGTVEVATSDGGLRLATVTAGSGWTWTDTSTGDGTVSVTFESAATTYVFNASQAPDGSILAGVEQPVVEVVTRPAPTASATVPAGQGSYEDDDEHGDDERDDEYEAEDDEHEDERGHEYEYEGREDDD